MLLARGRTDAAAARAIAGGSRESHVHGPVLSDLQCDPELLSSVLQFSRRPDEAVTEDGGNEHTEEREAFAS